VKPVFDLRDFSLLRRWTRRGTKLDDGHQALLVNGGGVDGGDGAYVANAGDDANAVGSVAAIIEGHIGCIVIRRTAPATSLA
jgi:hypothetical protein